jgi:hypothetical protein
MKSALFLSCLALTFVVLGCGGGVESPDTGSSLDGSLDASAVDGGESRDSGIGRPCTAATECDDGLFCNGTETCTAGHCTAGVAVVCDDHITCTVDACSEGMRACASNAPDVDGDGHADATCRDGTGISLGDDCADGDATTFPGNRETCDAHDEDCSPATHGGTDADADGFESHACCNPDPAGGAPLCGTDCNDLFAATHPGATEVCDGLDQDCDTVIDDIVHGTVFCQAGQMEACTTTCGSVPGMHACGADCLSWGACGATEICNGCDDDRDGEADDGFSCPARELSACTTACDTPGTSTCSADCMAGECHAAERCNFCDEDGMNGIGDELALATASDIVRVLRSDSTLAPPITTRVAGVATMGSIPAGGGGDFFVQLLDGASANEVGGYWVDLDRLQGWGPTTIHATLQVRSLDGGFPMGGWSVIVATGGTGDIGTAQNNGVPDTRTGAHFDWFWGYPFMGFPSAGDRMAYGGFPLPSWRGDMGRPASVIQFGLPIGTSNFDTGQTTYVTQDFSIYYQPENTYTAPREERVEIRFPTTTTCTTTCSPGQACIAGYCNNVQTYVPDSSAATTDPNDDVPVASRLSIGVTAGSYTMSFTAGGGPRTASATVDARLYLHGTRPPPAGSGLPETILNYTTILRTGICTGF